MGYFLKGFPPRHPAMDSVSFIHQFIYLILVSLVVCVCFFFKEIGPFYSRARIYVRRVARRVSYQLFHSRSVCSVSLSLIPNIGDLCLLKLLFFSLVGGLSNALIFFQRTSKVLLIFFHTPFLFSSPLIITLLLITSLLKANMTLFCLLWDILLIIFRLLKVKAQIVGLRPFPFCTITIYC